MDRTSTHMSTLPVHGRVACSRCFESDTVWNETQATTPDGWHIINNPMSWGSATPKFLVLGVSKGTTQCGALKIKAHDQVPFDGFRPKMTEALRLLGLLGAEDDIEHKIHADEKDWAFGSMVRCALGLLGKDDGSISRSGTVVQRLAMMSADSSWLSKCSSAFLSGLPASAKICVLLSNDDRYIEACRTTITRLRPATRPINAVAYGDSQVIWVHIIHVGGPGKNHIKDWFAGTGTQGRKRIEAQVAVSAALGLSLDRSSTIQDKPDVPMGKSPKAAKEKTRKVGRAEGKCRPVPTNDTRDAIIARLAARKDIRTHPNQASSDGTKYISAFATRMGIAFAVDKGSASKQPIWFLDNPAFRSELDQMRIAFDYYSPEKRRNSNVHKLSGFKNGALLRAYPRTTDEAMCVIDMLSRG